MTVRSRGAGVWLAVFITFSAVARRLNGDPLELVAVAMTFACCWGVVLRRSVDLMDGGLVVCNGFRSRTISWADVWFVDVSRVGRRTMFAAVAKVALQSGEIVNLYATSSMTQRTTEDFRTAVNLAAEAHGFEVVSDKAAAERADYEAWRRANVKPDRASATGSGSPKP